MSLSCGKKVGIAVCTTIAIACIVLITVAGLDPFKNGVNCMAVSETLVNPKCNAEYCLCDDCVDLPSCSNTTFPTGTSCCSTGSAERSTCPWLKSVKCKSYCLAQNVVQEFVVPQDKYDIRFTYTEKIRWFRELGFHEQPGVFSSIPFHYKINYVYTCYHDKKTNSWSAHESYKELSVTALLLVIIMPVVLIASLIFCCFCFATSDNPKTASVDLNSLKHNDFMEKTGSIELDDHIVLDASHFKNN
jgi:hypothetical protein